MRRAFALAKAVAAALTTLVRLGGLGRSGRAPPKRIPRISDAGTEPSQRRGGVRLR